MFILIKNTRGESRSGFTLIELLVVITVIGLLSTLTLISLDNARKKSRDTRRKADLKQIQNALSLYFDAHSSFPPPHLCLDTSIGCGICSNCTTVPQYPNGHDWVPESDLRPLVTEGFINKLPVDPINDSTYYYKFRFYSSGEMPCGAAGCGYELTAVLETGGNYTISDSAYKGPVS